MIAFSHHALGRLRERYSFSLSKPELKAICAALADDLDGADSGHWQMDVRLPERGIKLRCVVVLPAGVIKTVLPQSTLQSAKRKARESARHRPAKAHRKLSRGYKARRQQLACLDDAQEQASL